MIERIQVSYVATVLADLSMCLKWNLPLIFQSPAAWPQWNRGILFWEWKWEWRWGGAAGHPGGFAETERGTGGRIWFLAFSGSLLWWLDDCRVVVCISFAQACDPHRAFKSLLCGSPCCCLGQHCCVRGSPDICSPSLKDQEQSPEPSDSRGAWGHHRAAGAAPPAAACEIWAAGPGGRGAGKARGRFPAAERHCPGDKSSQRAAKSKQGAASQAITK